MILEAEFSENTSEFDVDFGEVSVINKSTGEWDIEEVRKIVEEYLEANPPSGGVDFETDETLILKDGILSVNTTNDMEQDNTLPITSAGVYATVGNIEALLKTI